MDHFVVSARKYRPSTFNSVVGQSSITNTLKNAIKSKHLAQAFLFCGPRGVGKTTCARILAKTINCTNLGSDTEGCNQCESCISFNNGQSLNIFELDAASNNSVEDMRSLVEQVRYAPQSGNYKIYIIDEVHMLSTAAFNAFLKTLEEPPSYAIFILATTEKHKIIPTILSRCQIFDFNRITIDDIAKHLQWVAQNEKVKTEPEALHTIAQKADGALRDALSIFDQIVSFAGNEVTYKHVIDNLNILDYEYYFKITDYVLEGNYPKALLLLNEIVEEGFDLHHFITGLSCHFRDLLVSKDVQTISLLEVSEKTKDRYKSQSQQCEAALLFKFLEIGNRCDVEFKTSQNQRLHVELALLKMCSYASEVFRYTPVSGVQESVIEKKSPPSIAPAKAETFSAETKIVSEPPANKVQPTMLPEQEKISKTAATTTTTSPETTPVVPPVQRTRGTTSGSISIKKIQEGKKSNVTESDPDAPVEQKSNQFDDQALTTVVKKLVEKLLSEGRRQLAVALNKHQPRLLENFVIEIPVDNPIQSDEIQSNKLELLAYFKDALSNTSIELSPRVINSTEHKDTAYTPAEKFNRMAEKNPDLNQLRQQFDLELDY